MKLESYILSILLVAAICLSGYALQPSAASSFSSIKPTATPSSRRKLTPRPAQSPRPIQSSTPVKPPKTYREGGLNTTTYSQDGQPEQRNTTDANRTETVGNDETMINRKPLTSGSGNQPGVQQRGRTDTATRKSQPRVAKRNQDIEVENDETHVVRPSNAGSNSAQSTQNSTQCASNKNCQEFEAVRNNRTPNRISIPATNVKSGKISTKRSKPRKP